MRPFDSYPGMVSILDTPQRRSADGVKQTRAATQHVAHLGGQRASARAVRGDFQSIFQQTLNKTGKRSD
ncbi:hypothetical protein [Magnetococcus sp. PR-3]|uniref:hypothetical protein n=1 Tax=Magnetococcus sp. PR-3 TaxID=3120355 RepID=UPI002FCE27EB